MQAVLRKETFGDIIDTRSFGWIFQNVRRVGGEHMQNFGDLPGVGEI